MQNYCLVDCNNFYVSCERIFNPKLNNKPVVVLSNNDGCVVARSNEVKQLGVPMGVPFFKILDLIKKYDIQVYSSNYALYADISNRVMAILSKFSPRQEIYSIDECFLDFTGYKDSHGLLIKDTIKQYLGLPVCVGIGPTKTLAKLANYIAKKRPKYNGVFNISKLTRNEILDLTKEIEVSEVWGVGRKFAYRLNAMGIYSVSDLILSCPELIHKSFNITLKRTVLELNGQECIELDEIKNSNKQIISSRSFGQGVYDLPQLAQAITLYTTRACEKLRQQNQVAQIVQVFIHTSRFNKSQPQYYNYSSYKLMQATNSTIIILKYALKCLESIYKPDYKYTKAGIMLFGLSSQNAIQLTFNDLLNDQDKNIIKQDHNKLMTIVDTINKSFGRGTIFLASQGTKLEWLAKSSKKSDYYTTRWDSLLNVYAK